jgi:hypothetical protein
MDVNMSMFGTRFPHKFIDASTADKQEEQPLFSNSRNTEEVPNTDLHALMTQVATNRIIKRNRWLTFGQIGKGPATVVPRVLLLWVIGIPLLSIRVLISVFLLFITFSLPLTAVTGGGTVGMIGFQFVYRDVLSWAMENNIVQDTWDAIASSVTVSLRIFVYILRFMVEIHNGMCPIYALFADILYSLGVQLVVIWYAAPVLQNFALFVIQLGTCLLEPTLDLLVTIMESFASLMELIPSDNDVTPINSDNESRRTKSKSAGMSLEDFNIFCEEHPGDFLCYTDNNDNNVGSSSRRTLSSDGGFPEQDRLLEICCVIFTVMVRLIQAFLYILLPIMYGFLRRVVPVMLTVFPIAFEIVGTFAGLLTSDAVLRIVDGIIQLLPFVFEFLGSFVCGLLIYLGAAACYIVYGIVHLLSFVLKYMIRPCVCGCLAIYAGCFEAFVMSGIDGKSCYTCGQYNTDCGCRRKTYPQNGCGGQCIEFSETAGGQPVEKPYSFDTNVDIVIVAIDTNSTYDFENKIDPEKVKDEPNFPFNTLPNMTTPAESTPIDENGVDEITDEQKIKQKLTPALTYKVLTNEDTVVTTSPTLYTERTLTEVTYSHGTSGVLPVLGSLPRYSHDVNDTVCIHGVDDSDCSISDTWLSLYRTSDSNGVVDLLNPGSVTKWQPVDWVPATGGVLQKTWIRLDMKKPMTINRIEMRWNANDATLQAPLKTSYHMILANGAHIERTTAYFCGLNVGSRDDVTEFAATMNAVASIKIILDQPCPQSSTVANTGGLYSLSFVKIIGLQSDSHAAMWTPLANPSIVAASSTPMVSVWDSCELKNLDGLVDRKRGYNSAPVVFSSALASENVRQSVATTSLTIDVGYTGAQLHQLDKLIMHMRGPSTLRHQDILVCPRNVTRPLQGLEPSSGDLPPVDRIASGCAIGSSLTDSGYSSSTDFVSSRASNYRDSILASTTLPSWWQSTKGFYTQFYYTNMTKGELGRDASYTFEFPLQIPANGFRVWFSADGQDPFETARMTNWATMLLELGLDDTRTESAQWRKDPGSSEVCNAHGISASTDTRYSTNNAKFGAGSIARRWFALEEFDAFATVYPDTQETTRRGSSAARRPLAENTVQHNTPLSDLQRRSSDSVHRDAVHALSNRKFTWEKNPVRSAVADVLDPMKSSDSPFKPSTAPENGINQPFYDDLSQMPDPALEPMFDCERYTMSGTQKMRCFSKVQSMISTTKSSTKSEFMHEDLTTDTERPIGNVTADTERPVGSVKGLHVMSKDDTIRLTQQLESLKGLQAQQEVLRDIMLHRITTRSASKRFNASSGLRRTDVHTRKLMGSGSFPGWSAMTNWVEGFVEKALSGLQGLICEAMSCSSYCTGSCDSKNLVDCFKAFGQWTFESIFGCSKGENILQCISRPLRDLIKWMLRKILWLVDQFGSFVGKMSGIGDMLKNIACIACSLTNIAVGVLGKFLDDFPASICDSIASKGGEQCQKWGIGDANYGAGVFLLFFPMMKTMFGTLQLLPALLEVCIEVAGVIFSDLLGFFPGFMSELFDIFLWLVTASASIGSLEVIFEAFDPIISGDTGGLQSKMSQTSSQPANRNTDTDFVASQSFTSTECSKAGETESTGARCGSAYRVNNSNNSNSSIRQAVIQSPHSHITTSESTLSFPLDGNCKCVVQPSPCSDGAGTGDCPYKEGTQSVRLRQQSADLEAMAKNTDIIVFPNGSFPNNDCSGWPYCAGVRTRLVGSQFATESSEFKDVCVPSKKCRMQAVAPLQKEPTDSKTLPFSCFSRQSGANGEDIFWRKDRDCPSALRVDEVLSEPAVHRRRVQSKSLNDAIQRRIARRLMGVENVYENDDDVEFWRNADMSTMQQFRKASMGFDSMIRAGNKSYAYHQSAALYEEAHTLVEYALSGYRNLTAVATNLTDSGHFYQTIDYTTRFVSHGRHLLFGFSGADTSNIACGWVDNSEFSPNTYPCCRGLWCCIPPPFADDFMPKKDWITWNDDWVTSTQCPYIETYAQAWMFVMQSICKVTRDAAGGVVSIWPYGHIVDAIWSVFLFPNDEWPDTASGTLKCVLLNSGAYILLLCVVALLAFAWVDIESIYYAHMAIFTSLRKVPVKEQKINIDDSL